MLSEQQYQEIRKELDESTNPLIFFDDDPDGLSSFLLLYRYVKEGHGLPVKTHPKLDAQLVPKIKEYSPDKIFVVDVALLEQEFIDAARTPIVWIDHHGPFKRHNVKYFNPRIEDPSDNLPTTYLCYRAVKQDLWIATVGCIADYVVPDFIEEAREKYPDLLGDHKTIEDLYFSSKMGKLIKVFSFCLKGKSADVMKNVKILTRIDSPYEILNKETPQGKFIFKQYNKLNVIYEQLLDEAISRASDDPILIYDYTDDRTSFTGDISNELQYKFPDKLIIVGRKKSGDIRMSIRSKSIVIPPILEKALAGLEGYGGGHEHACGASLKFNQFETFIKRIRELI